MRTTLDLDTKVIEEVVAMTGEKNKSRAINKALKEYLREARIKELLALMGNLDLDLDDWYEFRHWER